MATKTIASGEKVVSKIALHVECYFNDKGNIKMKKYYKKMEANEIAKK